MRTYTALSLVLLFALPAIAQPPDTLWTARWGSQAGSEWMDCVNAVPTGGYITSGISWDPVDPFNPQVTTIRLDSEANEIWFNLEGQDLTDAGHHIEPTSDGGFIQCGETQVGMQFDAFVRKLDADGNQLWIWVSSADHTEYFTCVREAPVGGFVAVGTAEGCFLHRISPAGQVLWRLEHINMPVSNWVEPTQDGGFIVPSGRVDGDLRGPYLYKVDAYGELVWDIIASIPGDTLNGMNYCVREDESGYLYTCGYVVDEIQKRYVSKRNPDGTLVWATLLPNPDDWDGRAYELVLLADGSIAVCGRSYTIDGLTHWLGKLDSNGTLLWEYEDLGGEIVSLTQGRDGGVVAAWWPRYWSLDDPEDLALIKWEPEVQVELTAEATLFPSTGGTLVFDELTSNIFVNATDLDRYVYVTGPDGFTETYPATVVTLQPGVDISTGNETLVIPEAWPDGEYTVELHYGNHPDQASNMGLGTIQIQKGEVGVDDPGTPGSHDDPGHPGLADIPSEFALSEPWPNPFNSSTTIRVELPSPGVLHVTVFNMAGQQVATLANGLLEAGTHEFSWDAAGVAAGVYFVRANAGTWAGTQKAILLK